METLSYRELADRWEVSLAAAKARVRRSGWIRVWQNDGTARVQVPDGAFPSEEEKESVSLGDTVPSEEPTTEPATDLATLSATLLATLRLLEQERERSSLLEREAREFAVRLSASEVRADLEAKRAERAEVELRGLREPATHPLREPATYRGYAKPKRSLLHWLLKL
ncbi:hypothetical protein HK15_01460 [Acetobacter orientalis]|uniref:Uncharacterized protein n=1 Tax=Acetobacter orientalis TaxID=146474 RepID=A0A252BFL5_9PROT|nr:hypothetical protein [Acetobacter orientalis]OUJ03118.1 hypothetical protein HK15_01460 [Acetobacter orientalis]